MDTDRRATLLRQVAPLEIAHTIRCLICFYLCPSVASIFLLPGTRDLRLMSKQPRVRLPDVAPKVQQTQESSTAFAESKGFLFCFANKQAFLTPLRHAHA